MPSHIVHHVKESDSDAGCSSKRMKLSIDEPSSVPELSCSQMIKRFTLDSDLESDQSLHELFVNGTTMKTVDVPEKENVVKSQEEELKLPVTGSASKSEIHTDFRKVEELLKDNQPSRPSEKAKYEYALVTYYNVVRSCFAAANNFPDSPDRSDELRRSVLKRNLSRRESSKYKQPVTSSPKKPTSD